MNQYLLEDSESLDETPSFHFFDSMFFNYLESLHTNDKYHFLNLGWFLDKHYRSSRQITGNSLVFFVITTDSTEKKLSKI